MNLELGKKIVCMYLGGITVTLLFALIAPVYLNVFEWPINLSLVAVLGPFLVLTFPDLSQNSREFAANACFLYCAFFTTLFILACDEPTNGFHWLAKWLLGMFLVVQVQGAYRRIKKIQQRVSSESGKEGS